MLKNAMPHTLGFSQDGGITEILITVLNFVMRKICKVCCPIII